MTIITENEAHVFAEVIIDGPGVLASPSLGSPFPCLIWDHDGKISDTARFEVARELLDAGCRYAVCGGVNCEAWHDAIDMEFVTRHLDSAEDVKDSMHVMTTWHAEESPEEVASFFVFNTNFDDHDFRFYLVVHVGEGPLKSRVDDAVRKYEGIRNASESS